MGQKIAIHKIEYGRAPNGGNFNKFQVYVGKDPLGPRGGSIGSVVDAQIKKEFTYMIANEGETVAINFALELIRDQNLIPVGKILTRFFLNQKMDRLLEQRSGIDTAWHPLADGNPPDWATGWGQHRRVGPFVEFTLDGVTQRLRWIRPGQFRMGSPADEPGRDDDEGPQQEVIISRGFWLFDTPCTQALWQAVMGRNPSYFQSPDRPVEQVSWHDVQEFLERINQRIPGLDLTLPTEAQWEYACRAGTTTTLWTGPIDILGDANAPALDPIAWYGGNSNVDFKLENGVKPSWLSDQQHSNDKAGSHPVARKSPNPWGLYDMLGNVWEWCLDDRRTYQDKLEVDPTGSLESTIERVIRGGSWFGRARHARAACRGGHGPDGRYYALGFRCAQVQA